MQNHYRTLIIAALTAVLLGCYSPASTDFFLTRPNDTTISSAVQDAIMHHENLANLRIQVATVQGVVSLNGYVKTIRQSDTAEAIAKKVAGVVSVENNLIVRK